MTNSVKNIDNLHLVTHPLVTDKISRLRDASTKVKEFRELVHEVTLLLGYQATQNLALQSRTIQTPMGACEAAFLETPQPFILPILRAGIGMVEALLLLLPNAKVGHIGLFRDEKTFTPQQYYFKIPHDAAKRHCYVCDPMLATGGSAIEALRCLDSHKVTNLSLISIIASPEGVRAVNNAYPCVPIIVGSLDEGLNEEGFIVPGLGDAGDRMFGTL